MYFHFIGSRIFSSAHITASAILLDQHKKPVTVYTVEIRTLEPGGAGGGGGGGGGGGKTYQVTTTSTNMSSHSLLYTPFCRGYVILCHVMSLLCHLIVMSCHVM